MLQLLAGVAPGSLQSLYLPHVQVNCLMLQWRQGLFKPSCSPMVQVKCLMLQLLAGVAYLHENWVLHQGLSNS